MKAMPAIALAAAVILGGCTAHQREAGATHKILDSAQVPAAVRNGFAKDYPTATLGQVRQETYPDGRIHYEIAYTLNGRRGEVEYSPAGEQLPRH